MAQEDSDGALIRGRWFPSPAQFEAYKKREVELAKMNLGRVAPHPPTLHSQDTVHRALTELGIE